MVFLLFPPACCFWFFESFSALSTIWHKKCYSLGTLRAFKGSLQWERTGVRKVPICPNLARTAAIEVHFSINFAVVFNFTYFRFRPRNAKWIGDVLPNRRKATIRSMFFSSFIMRIAYWRTETVCVLRQCAANCKKSPRNTNWKLKTLQYCCALPTGARCISASI